MLSSLAQLLIANTAMAAALAIPAFAVGRWTRYPALAHVLWVLAVLKLITPPLITLPIPAPVAWSASDRSEILAPTVGAVDSTPTAKPNVAAEPQRMTRGGRRPGVKPTTVKEQPSFWRERAQPALIASWRFVRSMTLAQSMLTIALAGSLVWFARQALALRRFAKLMSLGRLPDDDVIDLARSVAEEMGLEKLPRIRVLPLPITPMLWGLGPWTTLLMPARLTDAISRDSMRSLVAHELSHYARGDSWVRLLEFVATGLLWWHPLVWIARHELERAEEQCCDAMVVTRSSTSPRVYAQAILDAIDYACDARPLPPVASGLGHMRFLRWRITMIMRRGVDIAWTRLHRAAAIAAVILAILTPRIVPYTFASSGVAKSALNPLVGSTDLTPGVERSAPRVGSPSTLPSAPWTGATLHPERRRTREWIRIQSPTVGSAVELGPNGALRWSGLDGTVGPEIAVRGVRAIEWSHEADWLLIAGDDGFVTALRVDQVDAPIASFQVSDTALISMDIAADNTTVAIGDAAGRVWLWRRDTGAKRLMIDRRDETDGEIASVRFSPESDRLLIARGGWMGEGQASVEWIDVATGARTRREWLENPPAVADWSDDPTHIAVVDWGGSVTFLREDSGPFRIDGIDEAFALERERGAIGKDLVEPCHISSASDAVRVAVPTPAPIEPDFIPTQPEVDIFDLLGRPPR